MQFGPPRDAQGQFLQLLGGKWIVQALATAAELGVADALEQPQTSQQLAARLSCHEPSLLRLLRVLVGEGLLEHGADGRFALTALGVHLKQGHLRDLALFVGSPSQWLPWTALTYAVRTGESAFEKVHGARLFEFLASNPGEARLYDSAVDAFTTAQARALVDSRELDDVEHVVDVGGGRGTLLLELLQHRPTLRGTLVDRADVVAAAAQRFADSGLDDRWQVFAGNFFETLPDGADCYVIKHVLHNWGDEQAIHLLRRCAEARRPGGKIFVVEGILLPGNRRDETRLMDLEMLVLTAGGRERSKPEFRKLFSDAGLKLERTQSLAMGAWLMVVE